MNDSTRWISTGLVALTTMACAKPAPQVDTQADVAAINAVRQREIALAGTGNVNSLLTVFTSDVEFMPPGETAVKGLDGLRK